MAAYPRRWLEEPGRLLLLRHGDIGDAFASRYLGHSDPPLSPRGREQAAWWALELAGIDIRRILTSDLKRALATAEIIAQGRELVPRLEPCLREIGLGVWEGLERNQVARQWPDLHAARGKDLAGVKPPEGESFAELCERVWPLITALAREDGPSLLVTHAGVIRVVACRVMGAPLQEIFRLSLDPAGLTILEVKRRTLNLVSLNLPPLL